MIGGSGEKRTLRLVAQYADMCNVSGGPDTIAHKLDVLRRHCDDVGRDPAEITTTRLGTLVLTPDADETARTRELPLAAWRATSSTSSSSSASPTTSSRRSARSSTTGLDCLIFNMPLSDPDDRRAAPASCSSSTFA